MVGRLRNVLSGLSCGVPFRVAMWTAIAASATVLASCTGLARPVDLPQRMPSPPALPSPSPGAVMLAPSSLTFLATGAAYAQTVTVSQANASGLPSAASAAPNACAGIATVTVANATSLTVTPVGAGQCVETITGSGGESAPLAISVATTTVGGT